MQRAPGAYEFIHDGNERQTEADSFAALRNDKMGVGQVMASGAGDEEDGDVVAAAVGVGGVDEGLADRFERRAGSVHPSEQARWGPRIAAEDAGDGVVVEFAAEAVGGEQEEVAGKDVVGGNVGFDGGLRADGASDDVADGRGGGLKAADEAGAELLLDQRVVLGEEVKRAAAKEVAAAVANVGEPERWAGRGGRVMRRQRGVFQKGSDESGAHAAQGARTLGAVEDRSIGGADGALEAGVGMIGRIRLAAVARGHGAGEGFGCAAGMGGVGEACEEGLGGEMAGNFAGSGAAHAVADDKGAVLRQRGAGVLIDVAHPAGMREHGEDKGGRAGWGHCRSSGRNSRLRLLQSRCVCHFGTERPEFRDRCNNTLRRNRVSTVLGWRLPLGLAWSQHRRMVTCVSLQC